MMPSRRELTDDLAVDIFVLLGPQGSKGRLLGEVENWSDAGQVSRDALSAFEGCRHVRDIAMRVEKQERMEGDKAGA